jgi:hypothetical protein
VAEFMDSNLSAGTTVVDSFSYSLARGVYWDYVVAEGANSRIGRVSATWYLSSASVEYTESATLDSGDTSGVSFSVDISGGLVRLKCTVPADGWAVSGESTFISMDGTGTATVGRVTVNEVKRIIDTNLTDTIIEAFISGATNMVDQALEDDTDLSDDLKKEIERWLTAHMIAATRERQIESASAGSASVKYQGVTGKKLESTLYGQMVLTLDTTGRFASLGLKRASISAVVSF